ncbi:MAG: 4'-phosphopantetheinyl transferase superfamily protein [Cytophagales bacterium]|nr:4'-phosphopantetheinyl transferase superfamily protein [Cytophagales bacterium]MCA6366766.1 4'-phosphopantetheinyl transferase superfamily protein [Cytophagales bacterium]MCA6370823.1 4'-phosphopantetheinyl transferase superfamily protein [Cytophagales bacterium]MCA6375733.1 4'-phosphopantetheinyl transferase superfamily protein [Cytophagales bacterium]MCA6384684.1 4'-phosphopantetheinyl transferase superfamily protein [Cytophagales bacterium]
MVSIIHVFYSVLDNPLATDKFQNYVRLLPDDEQSKISRYRRWQDAHLSLFGKLLLMRGMSALGFKTSDIAHLKRNDFNKPYFDFDLLFNISHSKNVVVCAFSRDTSVGIDIEHINDINFAGIDSPWCLDEKEIIQNSSNPSLDFFRYWTRKEALIKADGRGMHLSLTELNTIPNNVVITDREWRLHELTLTESYMCHIACPVNSTLEHPKYISF